MQSQKFWLEHFKTRKNLYSDYQLAKYWGIPACVVSQYQRQRLKLPIAKCLEIAEALNINPLEVIISVYYSRANEKDKDYLKDIYFTVATQTIGARMSAQGARKWVKRHH